MIFKFTYICYSWPLSHAAVVEKECEIDRVWIYEQVGGSRAINKMRLLWWDTFRNPLPLHLYKQELKVSRNHVYLQYL